MTVQGRPALSHDMSGEEFLRWYWLKAELVAFARELGVSQSGSKELLVARILARLRGTELREEPRARRRGARQLTGDLTESTVIPVGQRCSRLVREWFVARVGRTFRFDKAMRTYFANVDGTSTLGDALEHYAQTRGRVSAAIEPQFEYNRFAREWRAGHPDGRHDQLVAAWRHYRNQPIDERGKA